MSVPTETELADWEARYSDEADGVFESTPATGLAVARLCAEVRRLRATDPLALARRERRRLVESFRERAMGWRDDGAREQASSLEERADEAESGYHWTERRYQDPLADVGPAPPAPVAAPAPAQVQAQRRSGFGDDHPDLVEEPDYDGLSDLVEGNPIGTTAANLDRISRDAVAAPAAAAGEGGERREFTGLVQFVKDDYYIVGPQSDLTWLDGLEGKRVRLTVEVLAAEKGGGCEPVSKTPAPDDDEPADMCGLLPGEDPRSASAIVCYLPPGHAGPHRRPVTTYEPIAASAPETPAYDAAVARLGGTIPGPFYTDRARDLLDAILAAVVERLANDAAARKAE